MRIGLFCACTLLALAGASQSHDDGVVALEPTPTTPPSIETGDQQPAHALNKRQATSASSQTSSAISVPANAA